MKKPLRTVIITVCILSALLITYIIGSGFIKNPSVYIEDFTVSEDGKTVTIKTFVSSSVGFIRKVSVHQQFGGKLYLDCYSAFGGINGSIGAKDLFTIALNDDTSIIAIYRNANCYETILVKNEEGHWEKA